MKYKVGVCALEISSATTELVLIPEGEFRGTDGRPAEVDAWRLTPEAGRRIGAELSQRKTPFILDYEHQTLNAEKNGQPNPRAATYRVEYRPGRGLVAVDLKWTPRAKQYLDNDEYGYISPTFPYNTKTGEVGGFFHAALTNTPAVDDLTEARAAAKFDIDNDPQLEDAAMNEQLLKLLGLDKDATEEKIKQAVAALKRRLLTDATLKAIGVDDDADGDKVNQAVVALTTQLTEKDDKIAALKANSGNPDETKYVPIETVTALKTEIRQLNESITGNEVDELVTAALSDGRLLKAEEDWARDLGKKDTASLKTYLDKQQPIAALKSTQTAGGKRPQDNGADRELDDEELAVCKATGVSIEAYKKANNIGTVRRRRARNEQARCGADR